MFKSFPVAECKPQVQQRWTNAQVRFIRSHCNILSCLMFFLASGFNIWFAVCRFVRRLLYFYKPSSKLYAGLALDHSKARQLTVVGCQFVDFLIDSDEVSNIFVHEHKNAHCIFHFFWTFDLLSLTLYFISQFHQDGQGYLEDLVRDMVSWLSSSSGLKPERCLQSNGLLTTLSQHYFLFLGTLSAHPQGVKLLEKCGLFQWWVYRKEIAYFQCVQGSLDKTLAAKCFLCCIIGMSVCMNGFLT